MLPPERVGCPFDFDSEAASGWLGFEVFEQTMVVPLEVSFDPDGRPYEIPLPAGVEISTEHLTNLFVPDGAARTMDGNAAEVDFAFFADEAVAIEFGTTTTLSVEVIREVFDDWTAVLGLRVQEPDSDVVAWDPFEFAYGTDGGTGAVTTGSVIDLARELGDREDEYNKLSGYIADNWPHDEANDVFVADLDQQAGDDTIVFHNGYGDGAFPLTKGYAPSGDLVAVVIWDTRYPWRAAIPDATPPHSTSLNERSS